MPLTPLASDGLGRRAAIIIGSVIMLGGVAFQVCAENVGMVVGARIVGEFLTASCLAIAHQPVPHTSRIWPFVRLECRSIAHR